MNEINKMCFLKRNHVSLCLFGFGNVAKGLVKMIQKQQEYFAKQGVSISINFVANSKKYFLNTNDTDNDIFSVVENFNANGIAYNDVNTLLQEIIKAELSNPILVDLTSSNELAEKYAEFFADKLNYHKVLQITDKLKNN
jgi:aspartokinase/homoserine dehydrogenase 1